MLLQLSPSPAPVVAELASMPPVAEVLLLAEVRAGDPQVLAGASALDRPVAGVHVGALPGDGYLLPGGELIVTIGRDLPLQPTPRVRYVEQLAAGGASGLVVQLDRSFPVLPPELIRSAERAQLPLIVLNRRVPPPAISQAVHSLILESQLAGFRHADAVQRTFHLLATAALAPTDIVERMAEMAGCPVVLENLAHHVMAATTGGGVRAEGLLADWESRSRRVATVGGAAGWLATPVGARGQTWGWVVLLTPGPPSALQRAVADHGANALAVVQLIGRTPGPLEHQAHQRVLADLIDHRYATAREGHERTQALGVPTEGRRLHAVVVRDVEPSAAVVAAVMEAVRAAGASAVSGVVGDAIGVLVSADGREAPAVLLERVASSIRARLAEVVQTGSEEAGSDPNRVEAAVHIGVGPAAVQLDQIHQSFVEADDAARAGTVRSGCPYATATDIDLRGLLHLLRDDTHVQRFVERELGPILAHDAQHDRNYLQTLVAYLEAGGNKSGAAARSHLSRATFYKHLDQIAAVIGRDLDDAEVRTALHLAVLTARNLRADASRAAQRSGSASSSSTKWFTRNGLPSGSMSTAWSAP